MDLKKDFNKAVDNVKDGLDEAKHRSQAEGERAKRDVDGDNMTAGEKLESNVKEGGHNLGADWDKTKRDVRNET
ncbi:MAG: hypothetical protein GIW99_11115 [Candidatus Eremiobacteraeota bacterium]|nr:hypothetical protein [Candidatus Eremiobacteraeota bacterium]MBC5828210.1 hypothetical protein [Candidatus Eremiobacteraeota bacterium]